MLIEDSFTADKKRRTIMHKTSMIFRPRTILLWITVFIMSCGIAAFNQKSDKARPSAASKAFALAATRSTPEMLPLMLPALRALKARTDCRFSSTQTGERSTRMASAMNLAKSGARIDRTAAINELCGSGKLAQDESKYAANLQFLRDKIRTDKKLLVMITMDLSDVESIGFWPIFESYQKDLDAIDDRLMKTIINFADAYNKFTLTDEIAMKLFDETMAIFNDEIKIGKYYSAKLAGVLPGKKAVRYLQIEGKIRAEMWCELAAELPLME